MKVAADFLEAVRHDLRRRHAFATERVAFMKSRVGTLPGGLVLLPYELVSVPDDDYVPVDGVGATIGEGALRKALQVARSERVSMIHVHEHDHAGRPAFSSLDAAESSRFMPPFTFVQPDLPHAAVVLSHDSMVGQCWRRGVPADEILESTIVGRTVRRLNCA